MDRKETEFRAEQAAEPEPRGEASSDDAVSSGNAAPRTDELFRQGEEHFAAGRFQQAIHVWTRILFVDRGNRRIRKAIDKAKKLIAERQRRLDLECAEAARLFESGEIEEARKRVQVLLSIDARHVEASHLEEKIAALERRNEPPSARERSSFASSVEAGPSKGILLRVPKGDRGGVRSERDGPVDSRVKMVLFIVAATAVFAASALYLYENWETIVSDGAFRHPVTASPAAEHPDPPVPDLAELRYYNGARLFEQGRYREALVELSRIDRGSPVTAEARSLILRIEERLLRSAPEADGSVAPSVEDESIAPNELASPAQLAPLPAEPVGRESPGSQERAPSK